MKRPPKNGQKAKGQIRHAKMRAEQRYGVFLTEADLKHFVQLIQEDKGAGLYAKFIRRSTQRISIWKVQYSGDLWLHVAYDRLRAAIASVLPPE